MIRSALCYGVCFCAAAACVAQQSHVARVPGQPRGADRQQSATYPRVPAASNVAGLPPVAHYPKVIFHNGLLTIQAQNSSLAEVLTAVHHATGASLEMPPTANNERVAVNLGPAPPNQVLASLLNGAPYDYVLLSRPENPGDLQTVILRQKAAGNGNEPGATQAYSAPPEAEPAEQPEEQPEPEVQEAAPTEQPDQPQAEQPNPAQAQPDQQQPGAQQENGETQPKTPEQLLEELKRMQMQQQQQQQGPQQQGPVQQQQPQEGQPQTPQSDDQQQQPQPQQQQQQPQQADTPPQNPINF